MHHNHTLAVHVSRNDDVSYKLRNRDYAPGSSVASGRGQRKPHPSRRHQDASPVRVRHPGRCQSVGIVSVDDIEPLASEQPPHYDRRMRSRQPRRDLMNGKAFCGGARREGRALERNELRRVTSATQPTQKKRYLLLSAAPFGSQVDVQRLHAVPPRASDSRPAARTSACSFVYFRNT